MADVPHPHADARDLGPDDLKALAHPLRVAIFNELAQYGPLTASQLAARLGESSGATSYHLRQLDRHAFVREVPDLGTARERWWERTPGSINFGYGQAEDSPAARSAADLVNREFERNRARLLMDYLAHRSDAGDEWADAGEINTMNVRLTPDEVREVSARVNAVLDEYSRTSGRATAPGARPVQIHFNAFPLPDTPGDPA